ncbi:BatA domain-containing protein [bacterium]|nr:BatA domain-containing protein [bacterium]
MWTFLNPLFLWAAGAAVIPLLLHLLQKRRNVQVRFSTLRFLKLAQKRSSSRVRLENLLLWLLRTLILLLLALAFALPVWRTRAFGGFLGSAKRDLAIVWDTSFSMGYESGRQDVWDTSRDTILRIISGLASDDRVCLFLAGDDLRPVIEQPTSDRDLVRSLVKAQHVSTGSSQLGPAALAAVRALRDSGSREREIFLITDGQALPWADFKALPADQVERNTALFVALLGAQGPQNVTPLLDELQPLVLLTNSPAKVGVRLAYTGTPGETSVALFVDDQEVSRRAVVPGSASEGALIINLPPLSAGQHTARLETPPDGLALDNTFHFLLRVREQLPVLVVGTEDDTFFLGRALNPRAESSGPGSGIEVERIDPAALDAYNLADYPTVFLANAVPLPGQALLDLEEHVRRGNVLVLFPGDRAAPVDYGSWTSLPAPIERVADLPPERRPLRLLQPRDPLFRGLRLPPGTVPAVSLRRHLVWGKPAPDAAVLLDAGQGRPFLLARPFGEGRVLTFSVAADRQWSDWPLSPFFLPLLHQIVQYGAGALNDRPYLWATRELDLGSVLGGVTEQVRLIDPEGQPVPIRLSKKEGRAAYFADQLVKPGIYLAAAPGGAGNDPVFAVNVARAESDLAPVLPTDLPERIGLRNVHVARSPEDLARLIEQQRRGRPLDELALWLVFALALVELFVANRASRAGVPMSAHITVQASGRVTSRTS